MTDKKSPEEVLLGGQAQSSEKHTENLIEQYKLYVQSHEKISSNRLETNKFFLTLNTAIIGAFGLAQVNLNELTPFILIGSIAGGLISYYWFRIITSYSKLNGGKLKIIHLVEKMLPLSLYAAEWTILGSGENKAKYQPFSDIEKQIPRLFIVIYLLIFAFYFPWSAVCYLLNN